MTKLVSGLGLATAAVVAGLNPGLALAGVAILTVFLAGAWCRGIYLASRAVEAFDSVAGKLEQVRVTSGSSSTGSQSTAPDPDIRVSRRNTDA
jgi:hypothetical protein